jgi:hypothetical protein
MHCHLEAVTEINMDDLAGVSIQHEIRRMPIAQSENITDHRHDGKGTRVVRSPSKPGF